jgi:hypothetical protein
MTYMTPCPQCQCVVEVPDAVCSVCGFDVALGRERNPGVLTAILLGGVVIGLLAGSLVIYVAAF